MNKQDWLATFIALLPDIAIAWLYKEMSGGTSSDFWIAFGLLVGIQMLFSIKNAIGAALWFWLYGKRRLRNLGHEFFQRNNFPKPEQDEDAASYLQRISEDDDQPFAVRTIAGTELTRFYTMLSLMQSRGIFPALRISAGYNAAVASYRTAM